MVSRNKLLEAPPYPIEQLLKQLGKNLRSARQYRHLTIAEVAEKIGTGSRAVMDAEKGKPSTGIIVYAALLWLYDMLYQLEEVASPLKDKKGFLLQATKTNRRVRKSQGLSNDF